MGRFTQIDTIFEYESDDVEPPTSNTTIPVRSRLSEDMDKPTDKLKNYFRKEIFMLRLSGISIIGNEGRSYKIYSLFCLSLVLGYPIVAFGDLFKHDFDVVSDLLIYELATIMVSCEIVVVLFNRKKIKTLLDNLEEEPFAANPERGGDVEEKLIAGCLSFTSKQAIICWASVVMSVGMATVATLAKRIRSSDYHDWEFTYGPITVIDVTHSPNYEITWLYQIFCTFMIGMNHSSINLVMAGILAHGSVQFKILQNNLSRITENGHRLTVLQDRNTPEMGERSGIANLEASTVPWEYMKRSLDDTVKYHLKILEITNEVDEIFTMLTLSIFLFSIGVMCFLVYHASLLSINDMRFVKVFTDTSSALFPVLLLCFWSQEMAYESEEVAKAAFRANFVGSDLRFQKSLNLIMGRSQRPVQLKAGKFIEISLPTFVAIMRTAYSAFMVLRNVNMK